MICRDCPKGRRYGRGSVYCRQYGMIIREDFPCIQRRKRNDETGGGDADPRDGGEEQTGLHENGAGAAGTVSGVLPGSGE